MFVSTLVFLILLHVSSATNSPFKCSVSGGWMSKGSKCYKWGPSPKDFDDATVYCRKQNASIQLIESAEENNFFREDSGTSAYWMGLTLTHSRHNTEELWLMQNNKYWDETTYYKNWRNANYRSDFLLSNYYGETQYCVTWGSKTGFWDASSCTGSLLFLCEKDAECINGRFGRNCSKTCHCYGEQCTTKDGTCKYGCHKHWMGESCDKPKDKVEALYYCLNTQKDGKALIIRANQHGIDYKHVSAIDKDGNSVSPCNKRSFSSRDDKLQLVIKHNITTDDFQPDCGAQHISDDIYKWKFHFAEFPGTRSIFDVIFEVTCDFEKADNLQRDATTNSTKWKMKSKTLTKTELPVELVVQDPYTGNSIKKTKLNQNARLVMQLKSADKDIAVNKISPHSCLAGTEDGVNAVMFLDHNGCTSENAQVIFSEGNGTTWWSRPFHTFTFPGYNHVVFTCQFDICFNDDDQLCKDRCRFSKLSSGAGIYNQASPAFKMTQTQTKLELV